MIDEQIVGQLGKPITILDAISTSWRVDRIGYGSGLGMVTQIGGRVVPLPEPEPVRAAPPVTRAPVQRMPPRTPPPPPAAPRFPAPDSPRTLTGNADERRSGQSAKETDPAAPQPQRGVRCCTACGAAGHYAGGSKCPKSPTYNPRTLTMNQRLNNKAIEQRLEDGAAVRAAREAAQEQEEARELAAVSASEPAPVLAQQCALCSRPRDQVRAFVRSENGNAVCTTCVLESLRLFVDAQILPERPVLSLKLER